MGKEASTGTVTFKDGNVVLGTVAVWVRGTATLTIRVKQIHPGAEVAGIDSAREKLRVFVVSAVYANIDYLAFADVWWADLTTGESCGGATSGPPSEYPCAYSSPSHAERMMRATIASAIDWLLFNQCSRPGRTRPSTADITSAAVSDRAARFGGRR